MEQRYTEYVIKSRKVLAIIVSWMIIGVLITFYDHYVLVADFSSGQNSMYSFGEQMLINLSVGLVAAFLGGGFLVFFVNEKLRARPYLTSILMVVGSFVIVSSLLIVMVAFLQTLAQTGIVTWLSFRGRLFDTMHLKNILAWSIVVGLTQFTLHLNDKFGQNTLFNLLVGKYNQPKEETRIFMIVDIRSSTSIAERLGNDQYHLFLRDFFADITHSILINRGEIYQYVGDEILISWRLNENTLDNRCLKCYFDMCTAMSNLDSTYKSKYGVTPDFKVGLHYGKVVAGEIGIIKKDITYSGDVLNTASRIHDKCNKYNVKILTSDALLELLPYSDSFHSTSIGEIKLRGRKGRVSVSTLEMRKDLSFL